MILLNLLPHHHKFLRSLKIVEVKYIQVVRSLFLSNNNNAALLSQILSQIPLRAFSRDLIED